jgi:hypothetical protein
VWLLWTARFGMGSAVAIVPLDDDDSRIGRKKGLVF